MVQLEQQRILENVAQRMISGSTAKCRYRCLTKLLMIDRFATYLIGRNPKKRATDKRALGSRPSDRLKVEIS
jgi:hypothetical protein